MISTRHPWILALRYLAAHPARSLAIVVGLAVAMCLPAFTVEVGRLAETELLARAQASPVLLGRIGNEFDLVMSALYFRGDVGETIPYAEAQGVLSRGYGRVAPLHLGFTAGGAPIVGTTLAYLDARGLEVADGRRPAVLGEVLVGAEVAEAARLRPGDTLRSDQKNLYNLAGAYPLLLRVVGVLAPSGSPDDGAIFTDVKTTWVLDGRLHGHGEVTKEESVGGGEENLEASLALFVFAEITPETLGSFHLHGSADDWPLTGILVWPTDQRAHDELLGDYAVSEDFQAVRPEQVVRTILGIVLRVQGLLAGWVMLVGLSTASLVGLVVSLTLRLREAEIVLMRRIGAGRGTIASILGVEAGLLVSAAGLLAVALTWAGRLLVQWSLGW